MKNSIFKKSKLALIMILIGCIACATFAVARFQVANASILDAADQCFFNYISTASMESITYNRTPLYDEALEQNGWQYDFSTDNKVGYALISLITLYDGEQYEVEDFKFDVQSPFDSCLGLPIYISHNVYLDFRDEMIYDLVTNELVTEAELQGYMEIGFGYNDGGSEHYNTTQTVNFASKATTQEYSIQYNLPTYTGTLGGSNCANVAGSVAIGYYDRFCANLVPDFQTYRTIGLALQYKPVGVEIAAVQVSLYQLNVDQCWIVGYYIYGLSSGNE